MSDQPRIDSLVVRYEELRGHGTPVPAEDLCRDCPELLAELQQQIRVLESMNALLGEAPSDAPADDLPAPGTAPASAMAAATRYRVLRVHAAGGLGEVLVAHDEELHRDVALKRLQAPHNQNPQSRSRFLREAEITGRLEHPSIVPVHAVGQDAEGRPFYTMRFVQGETLRQASERFHAADPPGRDPGERRLALRQLLNRFVAVCNTVAYAHGQGIVHRDVKPDNIILGPFGETLLVDWGLAKHVGTPEGESTGAPDTVVAPAADAATLGRPQAPTQPGAILGTPAYMSPEQAAGRSDALGPASDVYSLGATLYALLTGAAPVQGRHVPEILDRVKRADFLPPRQRRKDVPRTLEAICLKAMARQPEQRYATALALAADVEHWLADEPVRAWREPWTKRLRRWCTRHRTLVAVAAATAAVALVSLTAATLFLQAANQRERDARAQAEQNALAAREQGHQAAQNFQLARQAVDQYSRLVAQDPRLREHDLEELRAGLLRTAAQFCDEFVRRRSEDPEVVADQGRAYLLLGFITDETGAKPEAMAHYQKAQSIFAELAQAQPAVADYRRQLASSHDHLGTLFDTTGQPAAARAAYAASLALRQELVRAHPGEPDYQNELATTRHLLGTWYLHQRDWDRAREELCRSRDIRDELLRTHPDAIDYQTGLADVHNNLAIVYRALKQPKRAEEELRLCLTTWEKLTHDYRTVSDFRSHLATGHYNLGVLYADLHRPDEGETSYQKALELQEDLVRTHPTVSDYHSKLAHTHHNLGVLYQESKRPAEAETAFTRAVAINKKLTETHPTVTTYAVDLGKNYCHLGYLLKNQRKPEVALDWFEQAVHTHEAVLERQPAQADARESLGYVHDGRALALSLLHRYREALQELNRAVDLAQGPNRDLWRVQRAITLNRVGDHAQATAEAAALADQSSLPTVNLYTLATVQARAAAVVQNDEQRSTAERQQLAERYAVQAVQLLRRLLAAGQLKGPVRLAQLRKDADLDALRSRADFQGLVKEIEGREDASRRAPP
jgi:serine/threonine protein kinase/tetratricopeptide (TPR) repeat protein